MGKELSGDQYTVTQADKGEGDQEDSNMKEKKEDKSQGSPGYFRMFKAPTNGNDEVVVAHNHKDSMAKTMKVDYACDYEDNMKKKMEQNPGMDTMWMTN
jgi:hypothetical protein